eukprot:Gb_07402 [translate_table: standard]
MTGSSNCILAVWKNSLGGRMDWVQNFEASLMNVTSARAFKASVQLDVGHSNRMPFAVAEHWLSSRMFRLQIVVSVAVAITPVTTNELISVPKHGSKCKEPHALVMYKHSLIVAYFIDNHYSKSLQLDISITIVAGGGMGVEVFNRGVIPLSYSIKKRNLAGTANTYLDGIYLLFTYFTKPESMPGLEKKLNADDDVIRTSTFKVETLFPANGKNSKKGLGNVCLLEGLSQPNKEGGIINSSSTLGTISSLSYRVEANYPDPLTNTLHQSWGVWPKQKVLGAKDSLPEREGEGEGEEGKIEREEQGGSRGKANWRGESDDRQTIECEAACRIAHPSFIGITPGCYIILPQTSVWILLGVPQTTPLVLAFTFAWLHNSSMPQFTTIRCQN